MDAELDPGVAAFIKGVAARLPGDQAQQLLADLASVSAATISADKSWITFELKGYDRGQRCGQAAYLAEGQVPDEDGELLDAILHHDHNMRLLEVELIRWDLKLIGNPKWHDVRIVS
jgi:hypothetical protein